METQSKVSNEGILRIILDVANMDEIIHDLFDDMYDLMDKVSDKTVNKVIESLNLQVLETDGKYTLFLTVFGRDRQTEISDILIDESE